MKKKRTESKPSLKLRILAFLRDLKTDRATRKVRRNIKRQERKINREVDKKCKVIYQALGFKLSPDTWQRNYIFRNGEYHSEHLYGRHNGKTVANILRLVFLNKMIEVDPKHGYISIGTEPRDVVTERYLKEDSIAYPRRTMFCRDFLDIYHKIWDATPEKIRPRWLSYVVTSNLSKPEKKEFYDYALNESVLREIEKGNEE